MSVMNSTSSYPSDAAPANGMITSGEQERGAESGSAGVSGEVVGGKKDVLV
jgi:hypothetical protein